MSRHNAPVQWLDDGLTGEAQKFSASHKSRSGPGGPCSPTGKSLESDYVYVMEFDGDKIRHMTKIWNAGIAMKQLGWV